jgi:hypothetical protein
LGHKIALEAIREGEAIRKYGQTIGFASRDIAPGEWIHSHNVVLSEFAREPASASAIPPPPAASEGRTFLGYQRPGGKSGTRNYLALVEADEPAPPPPPAALFREVTLPEGTALQVELLSAVNSGTSAVGDSVVATLAEPVSIEGAEVLPGGARVTGEVLAVQPAGKVKGRASLALVFTSVDSDGETYPISARFEMVAPATKADDAKKIGIPAAGGAVLGAILGGKKGAAVGAAVGGGAGTAVVVMTPGDEVRLAEGTTLKVTLADAVDVRVPIQR